MTEETLKQVGERTLLSDILPAEQEHFKRKGGIETIETSIRDEKNGLVTVAAVAKFKNGEREKGTWGMRQVNGDWKIARW